MIRRNATNLVLLVMVGMLGLLAWLDPGQDNAPATPQLLTLDRESIEQIRIDRLGTESILLERRAGQWWLNEPFNLPAHGYRIASLLRITESRSLGSHPAAGRDLTPFGLAPPQVVVTLGDGLAIAFGYPTPLDNRRYLLIEDRFHLATDTLYYQLVADATQFIDLRLLPTGAQPTALSLPGVELVESADGWQVNPEPAEWSADRAEKLVEAWRRAEAIEVTRYSGSQTGEELAITLADGQKVTFLITARSPELILARPTLGIEYRLNESAAEALLSLETGEDK